MEATIQKDQLVRVYRKIRAAREQLTREYKAKYEALGEQMDQVESAMLQIANAEGSTGFKTADGTAYQEVETRYSIADDAAFYQFVTEEQNLEFFERRVNGSTVTTYMKAHGDRVPPGLSVFRRLRMKVRAPTKKVAEVSTTETEV